MSDLKHQTVKQLTKSRAECIRHITNLKSSLNGQQERLQWIDRYLFEKTPKEMTIAEIEGELGHKVIIK